MDLPQAVEYVIKKILDSGGRAYLVGGALRDKLLGNNVIDYDIATSLTPEQIEELFSAERTWSSGKRFGTIAVEVCSLAVEITTFRKESLYSDFRHPDRVTFVTDIMADLSRRDFTVNAMAFNPYVSSGLVDPFKGREDLENRIIRTVGSPYERFTEDPLRIMRGIRFCAQLDFSIETETAKAMKNCAEQLHKVSAERIRSELDKLLLSPYHYKGIKLLQDTDVLDILFSRRNVISSLQTSPNHLTSQMIKAIKAVDSNLIYRLSALIFALFPWNFTDQSCKDYTGRILSGLRYDNKTIRHVLKLLHGYSVFPDMTVSPFDIRRLLGFMGASDARQVIKWYDAVQNALNKHAAFNDDSAESNDSKNIYSTTSGKALAALNLLDEILMNNDPVFPHQLAIDGNDIKKSGIAADDPKLIGEALKLAYEWVLEDPKRNNASYLLNKIRHYYLNK